MRFKRSFFRFAFFCFLFFTLDYGYILDIYSESDFVSLVCVMSNTFGYNHLLYFPGIVITLMYIFELGKLSFVKESAFVIRNGKNRYIRLLAGNALVNAVLFAAEFVGVVVLFCTIRFENELLQSTKFYWCCILYAVMLCGYFSIVGISTILIKVIFNFGKAGAFVSVVFFLLLNSLNLINIDISPVYYADFIGGWFRNQEFNYIQYIIDLTKCVCLFLTINYLTQMVYLRKDVIFNE